LKINKGQTNLLNENAPVSVQLQYNMIMHAAGALLPIIKAHCTLGVPNGASVKFPLNLSIHIKKRHE